ncbi:uncharacterized protein LOC133924435 [Phragmites australis]|uniref:uncharacterized protein LOC133924435 n=1 Tax=Phragmites australis TaxID=29695 RepID=UPI002D77741F|nr:uncharacterized protein LOC133924435 [Phragmites australis]
MEGKSSHLPEITIVPAPRPVPGFGAVDVAKAASREPISPGSPSTVATADRGKESRATAAGADALPGWKLDALCQDSGSWPAMRVRFPYF